MIGRIRIDKIREEAGEIRANSLSFAVLLGFPENIRRFLAWIISEKAVTCEQVALFLAITQQDARSLIAELSGRNLVEHVPTCGIPVYRVCLEPRRLRVPPELLEVLER